MSPLELSLAAAALVIGMTGTWSPCGFSMVETLGIAGEGGRRFTVAAACAAFVPGAVVGGIATFGLLSGLGELIHGAGRVAYLVAAAIAVVAAAAEARGLRIAPQIRRQLPESWRWAMPLPIAALLYGVLLGPGLHHLRAELRRLGARRNQPGARERRGRARDRRRLRDRPRDSDRDGRAAGRPPVRAGVPAHDGRAPGALPALPARGCGDTRPRCSRAGDRHGNRPANRGDERRRSVGSGQGDRVPEGKRVRRPSRRRPDSPAAGA